ncbi:MAG: allantoicase [Polyangiaceae bacterium]|nr:allantoicase [Polyangiaceae bacterium]
MEDFTEYLDVASSRLGAGVLYANDEFFAEKENLIKPEPAVFLEHEYTARGKWMDGWESRRRREPGYDFALVRLATPSVLRGVVVDTAFFRGNYPEHCSLDATWVDGYPGPEALLADDVEWTPVLPKSALAGDSPNRFSIADPRAFNVVRLNIFPDGGVARLRVHGEPVVRFGRLPVGAGLVDLAAALHGARAIACSDSFFGPRNNLIMPGNARNMGEGWETRRRRGPGHDWMVIRLAAHGIVRRVEIDTSFFKGNAPARGTLEGTFVADGADPDDGAAWWPILDAALQPHTLHGFIDEVADSPIATHARFSIFPDGGCARLRLHGEIDEAERLRQGTRVLDVMPEGRARRDLLACCGSARWAEAMLASRPFRTFEALSSRASDVWRGLSADDWLEAFRAHPRIGEQREGQDAHARWSRSEQARASTAAPEVREELARVNAEYEAKHGFVFLICAAGKSAEEMLAAAKQRLGSSREGELGVAAEQQRQITELRLRRLLLS